jgi:ABC-type Fe3+ transport system permease subunit
VRSIWGFETIFAHGINPSLLYVLIFILVSLSAIALWLFQYMNQKRKIRREEMHDRKRQQFEELLKLISDKNSADVGQAAHPSISLRGSSQG